MAQLEEALRRRPDFARSHVSLAEALVRAGRPAEAAAHFRETPGLQPDDEAAARGRLLLQLGTSPLP